MTKKGTMRSSTRKIGISLTLDEDVLEWLTISADEEFLSISYLVNRFCSIAKEALDEQVVSPNKKRISDHVKERGLR